MARVYLDTSFVSACVTSRTDALSVYRRRSSTEWLNTQAPRHDVFISPEVIVELDDPDFADREIAMKIVESLPILAITDQVAGVALAFVRENLMPAPAHAGDAIHVAAAAVHRVEYLLSWNVRHLANQNKTRHLQVICGRLGLVPPAIITPEMLWNDQQ